MNFYALRPVKSNSLKCSSMQTANSIKLKFCIYITDHHPIYCIDFGEFRIISPFRNFTGVEKRRIFILYNLRS